MTEAGILHIARLGRPLFHLADRCATGALCLRGDAEKVGKLCNRIPFSTISSKVIRSGITYTSVREGIYAEAFPLFLNYYPSTQILRLPADGPVAYASRAELAEATANLMIEGDYKMEAVLLTGPKAVTLADLVKTINNVTGRKITIERMPFDKYAKESAESDEGGKSEWWFKKRISWYDGVEEGDGEAVDPLMERLLGRKPKDGIEVVTEILTTDPDYTWHQNYAKN